MEKPKQQFLYAASSEIIRLKNTPCGSTIFVRRLTHPLWGRLYRTSAALSKQHSEKGYRVHSLWGQTEQTPDRFIKRLPPEIQPIAKELCDYAIMLEKL